MKAILLLAGSLGAILIAAVILSIQVWTGMDGTMSGHGWGAMIAGVVLSIIVGVALMVLVFFSSRSGRDEMDRWS